MPRRITQSEETADSNTSKSLQNEIQDLNRMLGAVLNYLSDDEIDEIDIEYLLDHTEGLREWWNEYRERNRKHIEEEIKKSLGELTLEDLEKIREQIKEKQK
ncbi:hypothetical protein [Peribacillus acanthi]|uniref:hypothetical protein n=1 Tax=Peribacillus acanthi TaxID=2171554 RepID=UPI000D3E5EA0|nr:hypothetical protein [Peribacillus acanthi]